jgi:hypothetical protein
VSRLRALYFSLLSLLAKDFLFTPIQTCVVAHPTSCKTCTVALSWVKAAGVWWCWTPFSFNAEVNNEWSYTSTPPLSQSWRISRRPLPYFLEKMQQRPTELTVSRGVCVSTNWPTLTKLVIKVMLIHISLLLYIILITTRRITWLINYVFRCSIRVDVKEWFCYLFIFSLC